MVHALVVRIALIPSSFWPSIGGVEDLTRQLAIELSTRDDVEVWTSQASAPDRPDREDLEGIPIRRFDFALPSSHVAPAVRFPLKALNAMKEMESALKDFQPDLLHVVCFAPNGAYATALSRRRGVPLVVTLQGETVMDDHDIYDRSMVLRAALRRGLRRASVVTACSQFTLDDGGRFGLEAGRGEVVFNATSVDEIAAESVETPFKRYVLCLGRVVEKKGFDLMIEAFAKVVSTRPDVGLVIAGDGRVLPALRQQAVDLGIADSVYFTGPLGRAAVAGAMRNAAVFVMPSRVEPFGIVALEGWRGGTPVVVSARGGAPEFVRDGIDGLVVDPFDSGALAAAVGRILDDPKLGASFVQSALARLPEFTWSHIAERYRSLYSTAMAVPE